MTNTFFHKENAASYAERPPRQVPGFDSLHRMVSILLAERAPDAGRILVLGAGGGLELKALAEAHPGWSFDGIDPSRDMLRLAGQTVAGHAERIRLVEGYIDSAPDGPYDGATALLTFHFIPREQRLPRSRTSIAASSPAAPSCLPTSASRKLNRSDRSGSRATSATPRRRMPTRPN